MTVETLALVGGLGTNGIEILVPASGMIATSLNTASGSVAGVLEAGAALARVHPIATVAVCVAAAGGVAYMMWPRCRGPIKGFLKSGADWVSKKMDEPIIMQPIEPQPA